MNYYNTSIFGCYLNTLFCSILCFIILYFLSFSLSQYSFCFQKAFKKNFCFLLFITSIHINNVYIYVCISVCVWLCVFLLIISLGFNCSALPYMHTFIHTWTVYVYGWIYCQFKLKLSITLSVCVCVCVCIYIYLRHWF